MKLSDIKNLMDAGNFDEAITNLHLFESQFSKDAGVLSIVNNFLAECYTRVDNSFEGERYYKKVLASNPNNTSALSNLETLLREQGRYNEVREILNNLAAVLPSISRQITTSISMLELTNGNLKDGFIGYENRFSYQALEDAYGTPKFPRITPDTDLNGKTLLMRYEQGLGDTIQFARYANMYKNKGVSHLTVQCKSTLHRLILSVPGVDDVLEDIPEGNLISDNMFDYEVMMMSSPYIFKTEKDSDIPNQVYMTVKTEDSNKWKEKLQPFNRLKVGLVWSGDLKKWSWQNSRMNLRRSIPLDFFRPLLDADCDFFSLQKGERQLDLNNFFGVNTVNDFMFDVKDFYDTACLIDNLDLVIAVDTSTAHLAGALGKPVWMLSRVDGDWRWFNNRPSSPWYPSMKIYGQTTFNEWRPTIKKVAEDLIKISRDKND